MPRFSEIIEIFAELGYERSCRRDCCCMLVEDSLSSELRVNTGLSNRQCKKRYGSFEDKIDGAHSLGIIKADERDDLLCVPKIRFGIDAGNRRGKLAP
jgi:hypothetical protein